jgi:hypothetical protein
VKKPAYVYRRRRKRRAVMKSVRQEAKRKLKEVIHDYYRHAFPA